MERSPDEQKIQDEFVRNLSNRQHKLRAGLSIVLIVATCFCLLILVGIAQKTETDGIQHGMNLLAGVLALLVLIWALTKTCRED